MQKLFVMFIFLCCISTSAFAVDGMSIGTGFGPEKDWTGGRIALQWYLHHVFFKNAPVNIRLYLELSGAVWHANVHGCSSKYPDCTIGNIAIAPVLRVIKASPLFGNMRPYFEASSGPSFHSTAHVAGYNLGSNYAFQDLLGFGFTCGEHQQYDFSLHFLHYSNASLFPPNRGVTIDFFVAFTYHPNMAY